MVEISDLEKSILSDAVRVWTGWGQSVMPRRDSAMVKMRFGEESAAKLLPVLNALAEDFYSTNARFVAKDLVETGALAASQFQGKYPHLPPDIAEAFAWCYTFDFK